MKGCKVILGLVLVSWVCLAPTAPAADRDEPHSLLEREVYIPDIATFLNIGGARPAGCSWDGETVFFTSSMSGASQVYRLTPEGWPYQLSTFEDGIDFFTLSYGGTLAIVGASVGGSEQSQLYLMDAWTGRILQLTDYENVQFGSVVWARDDRSILYRSNEENGRDFFIYRMDLATGEATKVFGDSDGVAGYNYIADLSQDGNLLIVGHATASNNNDLYLTDLRTGEVQALTQDETDIVYGSPTLMPDNRTLWLTCNENPEGISRLAQMTVGSPEVTFADDGWIDPRWEIDGFGLTRDYRTMVAFVNEDGFVRLRIREAATGRELPSPPLEGIIDGAYGDRQGRFVIPFNGPTRAPDVWRWDPRRGELTQLTFANYAGIDRELFCAPQLVRYRSFDGLEVPAFLYLPPDYRPGTPIPFLIDAHGGPEGQFQPYFQRNIQYLLLNGYGLLAPNVRGSSGYGREYMDLDNYQRRKDSLRDYKAAADWLVANGYAGPGMIGMRGGSYGGYVVLGMITEYPELLAAAVDVVGIANFQTFLENTRPYRRALREAEYGPLSDPEFLRAISPIHKADRIRTPLMVVHGANDPRVPVGEARQILAAVVANGGEVDSLIFADEGHGSGKRVNVIREYRQQVAFFDRHLKGIATEDAAGGSGD